MFTPIIDLQVLTRATILRFTDTTGPDTGDGTKWDGVAGLDSTNVSDATLTVTDSNGTTVVLNVEDSIDTADPVLGDIVFPDITGQWIDGYYTVVYDVYMVPTAITQIDDYSGNVAGTIRIFSVGHGLLTGMKVVINGVLNLYDGTYDVTKITNDQFYISGTFIGTDTGTSTPIYSNTFTPFVFANAEMAIEKMYAIFAEIDESADGDEYLKQVEMCNGLLNALKSAITTTTATRVNNIYGRILRILDFNNMDLVYS